MRGRAVAGLVVAVGLLVSVAWWASSAEGPVPEERVTAEASTGSTVGDDEPTDTAVERPEPAAGEVECNLTAMPGLVRLVEMDGTEEMGPVNVVVMRDWIRFTPRKATGAGWLYVDGYLPKVIGWLDGGCLDLVELQRPPMGTVVIEAEGLVDGPDYLVSSSRQGGYADQGPLSLQAPADEPDEYVLVATFGHLTLVGEAVEVTVAEGQERRITLQAPALPPLGWTLMEVDDGLVVTDLLPDGVAARAGVVDGDRIHVVDGAGADELVAEELTWDSGPLQLELSRDDERHVVAVPASGAP
jgi:hypothetical protein